MTPTSSQCFCELICDTTDLMQLCMLCISMADPSDWAISGLVGSGAWLLQMDVEQVLKCNQFLSEVNQYMPIKRLGVIRMVPMQNYPLHVDGKRGVTINMLIQNEHSHCMFVDSTRTQMLELEYQIGVLYLFNTQIPHTVLNLSGIRYLLTIEFQEPKHLLSFNRALRYVKSLQKNTHPDS